MSAYFELTGNDLSKAISRIDSYSAFVGSRHTDASGFAIERARMDAEFYQDRAKRDGAEFDQSRFDAFLGKEEDVYKSGRLHEQKLRPLTAFEHFRVSNEVPLGAKRFRIQREVLSGQAKFHVGGHDIPYADAGIVEEEFTVNHIVMGVKVDHFELLGSNFAGRSIQSQRERSATRAINQKLNNSFWTAPDAPDMFGVLDHPWLAKRVTSVKMGPGYAGTSADVIAVLNEAANYPNEQSGGTFAPNQCVASPRLRNFLMVTERTTGTDTTIGKFFTDNNAYISSIGQAPELQDAGGSGIDYMLFYSDDIDSLRLELVSGVQALPIQRSGFDEIKIMFASMGGAVMVNSGNAILLIVDTNA